MKKNHSPIAYFIIRMLDLIDDRIIGHRWYGLCHWIATRRAWGYEDDRAD